MYHPGVTVVFSPLIALIQDQILSCKAYGIKCDSLNSKTNIEDRKRIVEVNVLFSLMYLSFVVEGFRS